MQFSCLMRGGEEAGGRSERDPGSEAEKVVRKSWKVRTQRSPAGSECQPSHSGFSEKLSLGRVSAWKIGEPLVPKI